MCDTVTCHYLSWTSCVCLENDELPLVWPFFNAFLLPIIFLGRPEVYDTWQ